MKSDSFRNVPDWYQPSRSDEKERKTLWARLADDERKAIYRQITWDMLPHVSGRSFEIRADEV